MIVAWMLCSIAAISSASPWDEEGSKPQELTRMLRMSRMLGKNARAILFLFK
jgi:hypothetical protein